VPWTKGSGFVARAASTDGLPKAPKLNADIANQREAKKLNKSEDAA